MKKGICMVAAGLLLSAAPAVAATWTGTISDSMCGVKHQAGEHGKKMTDRECTEACVKAGAKYVFVSGDKVYKIANQDFAGLKAHAGEQVTLTGEIDENTITVAKVETPKGAPAK
jgi:uncharacterized protein YdeI (BOF family)